MGLIPNSQGLGENQISKRLVHVKHSVWHRVSILHSHYSFPHNKRMNVMFIHKNMHFLLLFLIENIQTKKLYHN